MKRHVSYFVSHAHRNSALTKNLIDRLGDVLAPSKTYQYSRWQDTDLIVGEDWKQQILAAIDSCDFGLLLISPAFLASDFITKSELPRFASGDRAAVPVMLQPVDLERHDLKGLKEKQIFRLAAPGSNRPRAYAECIGPRRDAFVLELFRQIERKLEHAAPKKKQGIEDPSLDLRLFELALAEYRRRGTPKYFLDSQSLTNEQRAELYDKAVLAGRGRPAKNNPYRDDA